MPSSHASPPAQTDIDLEIDPADWPNRDFYYVTTGLVIPRPIGWISTISAAGAPNVAPYSFFNVMGSDPFYVAFGSQGVKDSVRNLREVPEFVCNIATMHLIDEVEYTAADFPPHEDEFKWAGLTQAPSQRVRPPRVGEAKAHLECTLAHIYTDGGLNIVLGKIVHAHVAASVWRNGRVNPRLLDPLGRLAGSGYASLGELYSVKRMAWREIAAGATPPAMPHAVHLERGDDIPKRAN